MLIQYQHLQHGFQAMVLGSSNKSVLFLTQERVHLQLLKIRMHHLQMLVDEMGKLVGLGLGMVLCDQIP